MFAHEPGVLVSHVDIVTVTGDEPESESDGESYDEVEGSGHLRTGCMRVPRPFRAAL